MCFILMYGQRLRRTTRWVTSEGIPSEISLKMALNQITHRVNKLQDQFNDRPGDKIAFLRLATNIGWHVSPNMAWLLSKCGCFVPDQKIQSKRKKILRQCAKKECATKLITTKYHPLYAFLVGFDILTNRFHFFQLRFSVFFFPSSPLKIRKAMFELNIIYSSFLIIYIRILY